MGLELVFMKMQTKITIYRMEGEGKCRTLKTFKRRWSFVS